MSRIKILLTLLVFLCLSLPAVFSQTPTSYNITAGGNLTILEYPIAWKILNHCANRIFISRKTSAEWDSFLNFHPPCVDVRNNLFVMILNATPSFSIGTPITRTKTFTMPAVFHNVTLNMTGFDDRGTVYLNGVNIFTDTGPLSHFCYPEINVTSLMHPGVNTVSADILDVATPSTGCWVRFEYNDE